MTDWKNNSSKRKNASLLPRVDCVAIPSLPEDTAILDRDLVPSYATATQCIHHMRYNKIKNRYIHNKYTYRQKYHVDVSSNININEMSQGYLLTCTNNYICVRAFSFSFASFVLFELNHPQRTEIISPQLRPPANYSDNGASVPSWSRTFL